MIMSVGLVFIVRRGALRRFDRLKEAARELPVDVIWDRRTAQRTTAHEPDQLPRALAERRRQPSFTWKTADFVLVEDD